MPAPLSRDAIITAARTLIADEGLESVSLRRLATSLGVTAPALYAHVEDKRDLLRGVAELEFTELIADFEAIDAWDPLDRLRRQSRVYIERAVAQPELFRTMFLFPPQLDLSAATGEELPMATHSFQVALRSVTSAIDAGVLRPIDPLIAAITLWTATHGAADVLLMGFPFDDATRDLVIDSVIDTVLGGLGASPRVDTP